MRIPNTVAHSKINKRLSYLCSLTKYTWNICVKLCTKLQNTNSFQITQTIGCKNIFVHTVKI